MALGMEDPAIPPSPLPREHPAIPRERESRRQCPRKCRRDNMEPFPLSELGLPAENKAIQGILCPMAVELCHLLLALEREDGICEAFPNLGEKAEKLAKALEELAAVAGRLAREPSEEEMCPMAKSLEQAGRDVLLAALRLQEHPESPRLREHLAGTARRVLTETAKVLQLEEAAGMRRITRAAGRLLECLRVLRDARDTPGLLAAFQAFSEAALLLSRLTAKRLQELGDGPARESLAHTLQLLHRCVPLLHGAVRHSRDPRADLSGDGAFQLTEGTIRELLSLLTEPRDRSGMFSQQVNTLLDLLSHPDRLRLSEGGLSSHVEAVVLHGMLLADSSRLDLQLELVERCWVLLRLRKSICGRMRRLEGCPGEHGLEQECHSMREELENLDRTVLRATLCQILEGFFEEKETLRQLVEGALALAGSGCFPAGPGGILRKLQPLTAALFAQAQQMLRAAELVLARCTKSQTAREIRERVEHLQSLLGSLPSLLLERSGNTAEQLQALCHAWAGATGSLLRCFEETVGTREFLELSVLEMAKHREWCEAALGRGDPEGFSWHAARLTGWARWVVGATTRHVDRATDPIFRNGLLVWVEQLANSILELRAVPAQCLQSRDAFSQAASCLMDAALRVQAGLDGSNHPDILSPLRERVQSTEVAKGPELSPSHARIQTSMDEATFHGDTPSPPSSPPGTSHPDVPWEGGAHPAIRALLAASRARDVAAVHAAGSALLELSEGCVDAAREALPVAETPQLRVLGQHRDITALTPRIISLAMETARSQLPAPGRLIHMALRLSGRIRDTQQCLTAVAGSWNSLSQQVLGFVSSGDFPRGKQALDEAMLALAGAVQLAGDIASTACSKENPIPSQVWDSFLQVQAKFSRAQLNTRVFLEKAESFGGSCRMEKAILELHGVRWAVGTCVLLHAMDRFVGRDVLFLRELSRAVRNKAGSRSLLAAVAENSLRLQEAARLSYLSSPTDRGAREILALRGEIQVLMEALLDVSNTLLVSPLPSASLSVRFELLRRDVALRARALLLHLERANTEQVHLIQDVVGAALPGLSHEERDRSKEAFEEKASRLVADVQWVRNTLRDALEAGAQRPPRDNLLSTAEHLLLLTVHAVGSARRSLRSHREGGDARLDTGDPQDAGDAHLGSVVWYWSAQARYLLTQLRATRGIGTDVLRHITECLQRERAFPGQSQLCPAPQPTEAAGSRPLGSRAGSGAPREAGEMQAGGGGRSAPLCPHAPDLESVPLLSGQQQDGPSSISPAKHKRGSCDTQQGSPSKVSQVIQDMAMRMLHMAQFLRKKGPIASKEQFVACARQIASDGQVVVRFGHVLAKQCPDQRCSTELLRASEHTHTLSSQLAIVARVKAVTGESKASSELLLSNAQNLVRAVRHLLGAAEAASVKGLGQPSPDPEAEEVAAFCLQWKKNLSWHRAKEALNSNRDELGLRKTREAKVEPTLMGMGQEPPPQTRNIPKHPSPRKGHTAMDRHL
ncbi:uncharacterized protein LOC113977742 isoform X2 [Neopelma chrysocephalum]|uniref:uncharacterized protein LOC113977742 isoform X2 n=1 Tax=Neopelma chrysocephalum TaxID=114329 RepID=UPI000FCD44EB|nr:uncharacterized protein LOC113977742 isoform X2 [Neopelma chrysocephalum]